MIKTPNVYSNFIKDNVKNKLSYTENFNAYAKENLGVDLDSESDNFYGADTLLSAKDIYSGYVQDFQQNIGTAKADMSQGITNTANVYKDAIVNYDTQLKQNQNAYGQRKENLASGGMLGSGWEKYIDDNVYAQYVEAVNILNNQSADVYKEYANAYETTEKRADRTLGKQADTLATNVYGKLQGDYSAYKEAYNEDIKDVVNAYSNVEKPTSVEGLNAYADYLDKETYDNLLENVQGKNFEYYQTAIDNAVKTKNTQEIDNVYAQLDADYKTKNISESDYSGANLKRFLAEEIKTQEDYDKAISRVKNSTKLTEEDREIAIEAINKIDKSKLKTEVMETIDTFAETLVDKNQAEVQIKDTMANSSAINKFFVEAKNKLNESDLANFFRWLKSEKR